MTGRKTKKGVSIGAAMKQRMGDQEVKAEPVSQLTQSRVQAVLSGQSVKALAAAPMTASNITDDDPLESFNTRLPRSLQRRLKVYVALNNTKIQDVLNTALDEYLKQQGN